MMLGAVSAYVSLTHEGAKQQPNVIVRRKVGL